MAIRNNNPVTPDIRELQRQIAGFELDLGRVRTSLSAAETSIRSLLDSRAQAIPAPTANLLWNGEVGHSVNTWYDSVLSLNTEKGNEAAWWYSHRNPGNGPFTINAADVTAGNPGSLTIPGHGLLTGTAVLFIAGNGAVPADLSRPSISQPLYAVRIDDDHIGLALSQNNALNGTRIAIAAFPAGRWIFMAEFLVYTRSHGLPTEEYPASVINNTLKARPNSVSTGHTQIGLHQSRWDAGNGQVEMGLGFGVEQSLSYNMIDASTTLVRVSLIAARRNKYVEIPESCRMSAGIWDNSFRTIPRSRFLAGSINLEASVVGSSTTDRTYRVLLTSDRGYSLLSEEVTVQGPADGAFDQQNYVRLAWGMQAGQLQADIYEKVLVGGSDQYRLIAQFSAGRDYIHLGQVLRVETGWPTPTGSELTAIYTTLAGELSALAIDGEARNWSTLNFPINVPSNYDKGFTTDRQWLRIWMSEPAHLKVPCTADGTDTVTAPEDVFARDGGTGTGSLSPLRGLEVEILDSAGGVTAQTTVIEVPTARKVKLGSAVPAGAVTIRIKGGGVHNILLDKIHMGFHQNTSYAPNAFDTRILQPVARPRFSNQGGVGLGGIGGGLFDCVTGDTPIRLANGRWIPIEKIQPGMAVFDGGIWPNIVVNVRKSTQKVRLVRASNGIELWTTDTERFVTDASDVNGTPLSRLRVGDTVLTEVDQRIEPARIVEISEWLPAETVYTLSLTDSHVFIGGKIKNAWWRRLFGLAREGGFVLHNLKRADYELT